MPNEASTMIPTVSAAASAWWRRGRELLAGISPEAGDALLYLGGAVFALLTIFTSAFPLYQVWGRMAMSPYCLLYTSPSPRD